MVANAKLQSFAMNPWPCNNGRFNSHRECEAEEIISKGPKYREPNKINWSAEEKNAL